MSKLYLISPPNIVIKDFSKELDIALNTQKIDSFQLRLKNLDIQEIEKITKALLPICHNYGVPFFINDFVEIARNVAVDGVHIGQKDGNIKKIKEEFGADLIIGASCGNSKDAAMRAGEAGAGYLSYGAFFPTQTKLNTEEADLELLAWTEKFINLPFCAIGGINHSNIQQIAKFNPDFICVVSAVWNYSGGVEKGVNELYGLLS